MEETLGPFHRLGKSRLQAVNFGQVVLDLCCHRVLATPGFAPWWVAVSDHMGLGIYAWMWVLILCAEITVREGGPVAGGWTDDPGSEGLLGQPPGFESSFCPF